jgi:hypothetical protein
MPQHSSGQSGSETQPLLLHPVEESPPVRLPNESYKNHDLNAFWALQMTPEIALPWFVGMYDMKSFIHE